SESYVSPRHPPMFAQTEADRASGTTSSNDFCLVSEQMDFYNGKRRMSAQEFHLEIGNVLFMDIVGYSKLLTTEQCELLQQLNQVVRATMQFRSAEAANELIRLPTGDGMALIFLRTAEAPVE